MNEETQKQIGRAIFVAGLGFSTTVAVSALNEALSVPQDSTSTQTTRSTDDPSLNRSTDIDTDGVITEEELTGIPTYESLPEYYNIAAYYNEGQVIEDLSAARDWFKTPGTNGYRYLVQNSYSTNRLDLISNDWTSHTQTLMDMYQRFPGFLTPEQLKLCQLMVNMGYINKNNQLDSMVVKADPNRLTAAMIVYPKENVAGKIAGFLKPDFSYSRYVTKVDSAQAKDGQPKEIEKRCINEEDCIKEGKPVPDKTPVPPTETVAASSTPTDTPKEEEKLTQRQEQRQEIIVNLPPVPSAVPTVVPSALPTPTRVPTEVATSTPIPNPTEAATPVPPTNQPTNEVPVNTATQGPTAQPAATRTPEGTLFVPPPTNEPTNVIALSTATQGPTAQPAATRTPPPGPSTLPTIIGTSRPAPTPVPTRRASTPVPPTAISAH